MKVALWGYYGPNYGDNIMMQVILNFFAENNIKVEIVDMFNLSTLMNSNGTYTLYAPKERYCQPNSKWKSRFYRLMTTLKLSRSNILNIWGGGTIFTDCDGDGNFGYFKRIKQFGGKFAYIGVGIGALTKQERIDKTEWLLQNSSFANFRDEKSIAIAKKYNPDGAFNRSEDLSYVYFKKFQPTNNSYGKYILISWRNLVRYFDEGYENQLMKNVISLVQQLCIQNDIHKIVLSALDINYDQVSSTQLKKLIGIVAKEMHLEVEIVNTTDVDEISNLIYHAQYHICGRLHGCVASEFFGVKTLGLSYSKKINYFYDSIDRVNYIDLTKSEPWNNEKAMEKIASSGHRLSGIDEEAILKNSFKQISI